MREDNRNHGLGPSNLFTLNVVCCTDKASPGEIEHSIRNALRDLADMGHIAHIYRAEVYVCVTDISTRSKIL